MILLQTPLSGFWNDLADVVRLFYGQVEMKDSVENADEIELSIQHEVKETADFFLDIFVLRQNEYKRSIFHKQRRVKSDVQGKQMEKPEESINQQEEKNKEEEMVAKRFRKRYVKHALYTLLRDLTGIRPPWGSLTGIRPTRLLYEKVQNGETLACARQNLTRDYDVRPDKAQLLSDIYLAQKPFIHPKEKEYDVYIGIPFCTTRCSYCSFASVDLKHGEKWMDAYVKALEKEMAGMQETLSDYKLRSLYIGGGTPTALTEPLFAKLMEMTHRYFPSPIEFTVEAGRPDTINKEKLDLIYDAGARRISVNPQTMNDVTLQAIGRAHSAKDVLKAMELVRNYAFDSVNMDLIVSLPGETLKMLAYTLSEIARLRPENLTVHTLAIKRSSRLHLQSVLDTASFAGRQADQQAGRMVEYAIEMAQSLSYRPYYLYRQKMMAGNLENIGWCQEGKACIYNIDNMEETTPVMAFGAGGISKWMFDQTRRIERSANVKNVEEYIARVEEMITRKKKLLLEEKSLKNKEEYLKRLADA